MTCYALRRPKYAPNLSSQTNEDDRSTLEAPITMETVASRLRRFYAFSSQVNSSEEPESAERERKQAATS